MAYQSFEKLEVWKRSCQLAVAISRAISKSTHFALKDQIQRSAISIPSNIAEGSERDSRPDFIRFLRIAKGSSAELRTQCYIALKLELLGKAEAEKIVQETKEVYAMLQGLINSLSPQTEN